LKDEFERGKFKVKYMLITAEEMLIVTQKNRIYSLLDPEFRRKLLKLIEKEVSAFIEAYKCAEE